MGKKQQKRYVVWEGRNPGIFDNWTDCQKSISGYKGAQYKSYPTRVAAVEALTHNYHDEIQTKDSSTTKKVASIQSLITQGIVSETSICVDAACSSNPGRLEWRGVVTTDAKELFHSDIYELGTTNIGERLALIDGMRYLQNTNKNNYVLYSDSRIALGWVQQKTIRTTLPRNSQTKKLWNRIDEGLLRLRHNTTTFLCRKRHTAEWGEIPADFGRK